MPGHERREAGTGTRGEENRAPGSDRAGECASAGQAVYKMETAASTCLFHGFSRSSQYLKAHKTDVPAREHKDVSVRNRRKSRRLQRFLLRKTFLMRRRLLDKDKSEESSCSLHNEDSFPGCPQQDEDSREMKAALSSICDSDSGLSLAGSALSTPASSPVSSRAPSPVSGTAPSPLSSRTSSPVSWLNPGKCVAIDCEMVGTGPGGRISELARCSVVNYCGDVLYDKYIKPELPVTDYRTRWSGITKQLLKNAISFKTAQKEIIKLLKGKWVVGHALHHDFRVLKYFHPWEKTRDTSEITLLKQLAGLPTRQSPSLKMLALHILQKRIQVGKMGHSSVEDAQTSMELYRFVEEEVERDYLHSPQLSDSNGLDEDHTTVKQYLEDQYWPSDLTEDCK